MYVIIRTQMIDEHFRIFSTNYIVIVRQLLLTLKIFYLYVILLFLFFII